MYFFGRTYFRDKKYVSCCISKSLRKIFNAYNTHNSDISLKLFISHDVRHKREGKKKKMFVKEHASWSRQQQSVANGRLK